MPRFETRRAFLSKFTSLGLGFAAQRLLPAQNPSLAHRNVTELDHGTILAQARNALNAAVQPPPSATFHTETEPNLTTAGATPQPKLLRADADALRTFSNTVASLTAGFLLTHDDAFAQATVAHCKPWLLDPKTRLSPAFDQAGCAPNTSTGTPMGVVDLVPLAELARALSFVTDAFAPDDLTAVQAWFNDTQHWLATDKQAFIAREAKDHRASAWLLVSSAIARFTRDENTLEDNRKRFRTHTLRNQIRPDGTFPQELSTPNPYRNTLLNFDLLAGACQVLSSQFDLLWDYQLIDEVGLRSAAAYLYPVIAHPEKWGFIADASHFRDLPGRRPGLLFAGRAYNRPEYVETWLNTPAPPPPEDLAYAFPIRQPALWTARAPHGL
jgi:hypothetical protein